MTTSAHKPSRMRPRSAMRIRVAGQEVIFRMASSRVSEAECIVAAEGECGSGVAADAGPWKFESGLDVLLAHHVIDRQDTARFCLRHKIKRCVSGILVQFFRNLGDAS